MPFKIKPLPDADLLHRLFSYEPETGLLRWRIKKGRVVAGDVAGTLSNTDRYIHVVLRVDGVKHALLAHRIVWKMANGFDPPRLLDHRNGVRTDNRVENLRLASDSQNTLNSMVRSDSVSGIKGVHCTRNRKSWFSRIALNGKIYHLGTFATQEEARRAYAEAAPKYHGEFARTD